MFHVKHLGKHRKNPARRPGRSTRRATTTEATTEDGRRDGWWRRQPGAERSSADEGRRHGRMARHRERRREGLPLRRYGGSPRRGDDGKGSRPDEAAMGRAAVSPRRGKALDPIGRRWDVSPRRWSADGATTECAAVPTGMTTKCAAVTMGRRRGRAPAVVGRRRPGRSARRGSDGACCRDGGAAMGRTPDPTGRRQRGTPAVTGRGSRGGGPCGRADGVATGAELGEEWRREGATGRSGAGQGSGFARMRTRTPRRSGVGGGG